MDLFDEYLDEVYGTFDVCGITFKASDIMKNCDPVAYRCYQADFRSFDEVCSEDE
jgi:hypothetical protein